MLRSALSVDLIEAYCAARYEVDVTSLACGIGLQVLKVGQAMGAPLSNHAGDVLVITAFNPFSRLLSDAENHARQARLTAFLDDLGLKTLPAFGRDPNDAWPGEPSLAVLDPPVAQVPAWLVEFEQNAALLASDSAPARLLLHPDARMPAAASAQFHEASPP